MWFWRDTYFKALKDVAADARASAEWVDYAAYCTEHERGLRSDALVILDKFISRMESAPFVERRRFVSWLLHHADECESHLLLPHPLQKRIVETTLNEWLQLEPLSSEPHRWLGGYEHLKKAIELDPLDQIARLRFIKCILGAIEFSTHHLPDGYIGTADRDLALLAEAELALVGLPVTGNDRTLWTTEIADQRRLIEDYIQRR